MGGWRKKGVKYGARVTFYGGVCGYSRRIYGHVMGINYGKWDNAEAIVIVGAFGLGGTHIATIRPVKNARVLTEKEMETKFGFAH